MLLHDSTFRLLNDSTNDRELKTVAYSPLFHSVLTLFISFFGLFFNFLCTIKLWSIISDYKQRKHRRTESRHRSKSSDSVHLLAPNRYRYLLILTSNDFLLCLTATISCLDEKYFFQSFLARHHLCAAQVLAWKFTLHFSPLLIIFILCRYHLVLYRKFRLQTSNVSTMNQLFCSHLSILIPLVLALAWSVDGLWLWGVANIKDFLIRTKMSNATALKSKEEDEETEHLYLPEQKTICHLQTNHNFHFTIRLIYLIQADYLLLLCLHLIAFFLEILLQIRICCCIWMKKVSSTLANEKQLCLYVLYLFTMLTLTSLPFYIHRILEILVDPKSNSMSNEFLNGQMFAQLLLFGVSFKPILFFMLFHLSSILCLDNFYRPHSMPIIDEEDQPMSTSDRRSSAQHIINHSPRDRTSSLTPIKLQSKSQRFSTPI